jgi:hypothetical protein
MLKKKREELSFEILEKMTVYPELDKVSELINIAIDNYKVLKKLGKITDASEIKTKIKEMKFSKEHLNLVLNLDFNRPSKKMAELARAAGVDLKDGRML